MRLWLLAAGLKFASLLPPGHILVKTAEAIKQQQEFQAALAHITPRPGQQRAVVPPLQLPPLQEQQQGTNLAGRLPSPGKL